MYTVRVVDDCLGGSGIRCQAGDDTFELLVSDSGSCVLRDLSSKELKCFENILEVFQFLANKA